MTPPAVRRAQIAVVALAVLVAAAAVGWILHGRHDVAGTNSIGPATRVAAVPAGGRLCVRGLEVPAGAGAVSMQLATAARPGAAVGLTLRTPAGVRTSHAMVSPGAAQLVSFPIAPLHTTAAGSLCLTPAAPLTRVGGTGTHPVTGVNYVPQLLDLGGRPQATLDGRPVRDPVSVRFLWARPPTVASQLGTAAHRAALFRPGFVGSWTYVALLVLIPLLAVAAVTLTIRQTRGARA